MNRGIPAATVMGQARAAMRAAEHAQLPTGTVLGLLDVQLTDVTSPGRLDELASPLRHRLPAYPCGGLVVHRQAHNPLRTGHLRH
jgi:hypothetical protein